MRMPLPLVALAAFLLLPGLARAADPDDIFIIRTTAKTPDAIVAAVEAWSEQRQWNFLGANKVKQGQVTLVKLCIPAVGKLVWPAGLRLSALLPCGNLGIYANGSMTEISVLHPRYMPTLYPDPALEQAAAVAEPLLTEMLDAITR
jgi:hypothetical protein